MAAPSTNYIFMDKKLPEPYQLLNLISRDEGWDMAEHDHPMFQMIWVTQGTLRLSHNGMDHYMRRGHLCIIPPGERHALWTESGYTQLGFDLMTGDDRRGIVALMEARVKNFVLLDRTDLLSAVAELEAKYRQFTVLAKLQMVHKLDEILMNCVETLDSEISFRQQMIVLLEQQLSGKLTLRQVSERLTFSPSHLERMTKREFGCSVMELYHRMKLNKAYTLLIRSNLSVKQIAEELGFCDQAHFSRFFKQRTNVTPSQFKQSNV